MKESADAYIAGQPQPQRDICEKLRSLILEVIPEIEETVKWNSPHYQLQDAPVCYVASMGKTVNLGFWQGASLNDPYGIVEGNGKNLRHVKIHSLEQYEQLSSNLKTLLTKARSLVPPITNNNDNE